MAAGYRIFNVTLKRREQVTPSLLRCVFSGPEVAQMKHEAPDQRIKLLFAAESGKTEKLSVSDSWYQDYLALAKEHRPVMRTYTLRRLNAVRQEVEVEFVLHGVCGPASAWAMQAKPGDELQMVAPNGEAKADSGGYEWTDSEALRQALIVADETALPAALNILESLAEKANPPQVQAYFTVPLLQDIQSLDYPFADIRWFAREQGADIALAVERNVIVPEWAKEWQQSTEEHSQSESLLWERAESTACFQAWVAAESSLVKTLRRSLLEKHQLNRNCVSFMAYWARGRV